VHQRRLKEFDCKEVELKTNQLLLLSVLVAVFPQSSCRHAFDDSFQGKLFTRLAAQFMIRCRQIQLFLFFNSYSSGLNEYEIRLFQNFSQSRLC